MRRVVITGIGALTPIGNTYPKYVEGLRSGISGAGSITKFDASLFKVKFACELKQFDVEQFIPRKEARRLDPFAQYAMVVAEEAIQMSGLDLEKIDLDKAGVIWGTGIGGFETIEHDIAEATLWQGEPRYSPFLIPKLIGDIAPGHISIKYGFRGINYGTVSACASSTHSIIASFDYIRMGRADIMITGGSEAAITKASVGGFSAMKAMSERNDDPSSASRPFDKDRDGFVLGEGGGALVLEDMEHAKRRGATIYGEIVGAGMTADAYHMTAPHPEGLGARNVMKNAILDAGITPDQVEYVNVHGTSTPLGDIAETKAIQAVFGDAAYGLNISSTKSMTGHLLGGAGAIEAIACIAAINEGFIPPTINHFTDDPEFDPKLNFTFNKAQDRKIDIALSNTFGFGGHNASLIVKRYTE
ncbi:MAG: beta-ketoacyl-ACP synthase II [Saprospiraceae bacterium]